MSFIDNDSKKALAHILAVDDDFMNLRILEMMLGKQFRVSCMTSGEEALAFLKEQRPDLILLDLRMPEMDGFQVIEQLNAEEGYPDIPVVFLTGEDDPEVRKQGLAKGASDFITKPFVKDSMLQCVNRILGGE